MAESQMLLTAEDILVLAIENPAVFLETFTDLDGVPFRLEPYQANFLNDRSAFRLVNKARQIGFSTVIAAEGFHRAVTASLLKQSYEADFISVNRKEAAAKIEIIRRLYHSMPDELALPEVGLKPVLWNDSEHEIVFGRSPFQGTLVSQPASAAVRGGRKDIVFDEFAHIRDSTKLYQAALPAISRGNSRITIVSTPLGESGLFYDIAIDRESYPEFSIHVVPWWESRAMVRPGLYEEAIAAAESDPKGGSKMLSLGTFDRVKTYGSDKLNAIFRSFGSDMISFQTEYEATFVDEAESYYPWELVISCRDDEQSVWDEWPDGYEPTGWLAIGMDLAKERDETVVTVCEIIEHEGETRRVIRFMRSMHSSYQDQFRYLARLVAKVKPNRVSIDATGVGAIFVEQAKRELANSNIEAVTFTNPKKERWATTLKNDMQLGTISYPPIPDFVRQTHGIRRTKSESGFFKFAGTHDDWYWSAILACYGEGRTPARMSFV